MKPVVSINMHFVVTAVSSITHVASLEHHFKSHSILVALSLHCQNAASIELLQGEWNLGVRQCLHSHDLIQGGPLHVEI